MAGVADLGGPLFLKMTSSASTNKRKPPTAIPTMAATDHFLLLGTHVLLWHTLPVGHGLVAEHAAGVTQLPLEHVCPLAQSLFLEQVAGALLLQVPFTHV